MGVGGGGSQISWPKISQWAAFAQKSKSSTVGRCISYIDFHTIKMRISQFSLILTLFKCKHEKCCDLYKKGGGQAVPFCMLRAWKRHNFPNLSSMTLVTELAPIDQDRRSCQIAHTCYMSSLQGVFMGPWKAKRVANCLNAIWCG